MNQILHSKPWITDAERVAIQTVLESRMLAQGERVGLFERAMSKWVGVDHGGVAVGSGSAAVVLALMALRIGAGDEVVLPTYICPSLLEAVLTCGGTPVFCDVGEQWVVTPESVIPHLSRRTKAIIVPHTYGVFAHSSRIRALGFPVIEDFAQGVAGPDESVVEGDIAIFSFHPTKCLTTGEGGMALSPDLELNENMRKLRDGTPSHNSGRLFSCMSDMAASLGLCQLSRYGEGVGYRMNIAAAYFDALSNIIPEGLPWSLRERTMWFRFPLTVSGGLDKWQEPFLRYGIHVRRGIDGLLHRFLNYSDDKYPVSVAHFERTVSLPIYPAMTGEEVDRVAEAAALLFAGVAE